MDTISAFIYAIALMALAVAFAIYIILSLKTKGASVDAALVQIYQAAIPSEAITTYYQAAKYLKAVNYLCFAYCQGDMSAKAFEEILGADLKEIWRDIDWQLYDLDVESFKWIGQAYQEICL